MNQESDPRMVAALVTVVVGLLLIAVIIWLVVKVDGFEQECIKRNGETYCKEIMP